MKANEPVRKDDSSEWNGRSCCFFTSHTAEMALILKCVFMSACDRFVCVYVCREWGKGKAFSLKKCVIYYSPPNFRLHMRVDLDYTRGACANPAGQHIRPSDLTYSILTILCRLPIVFFFFKIKILLSLPKNKCGVLQAIMRVTLHTVLAPNLALPPLVEWE